MLKKTKLVSLMLLAGTLLFQKVLLPKLLRKGRQ